MKADVEAFCTHWNDRVRSGESSRLSSIEILAIEIYDKWLTKKIDPVQPKDPSAGCYHQFGYCQGRIFTEKWDSMECHP